VLLVELVDQVGLKDGATTGICWQLVKTATKPQNVLTSRTAASMKAKYYIVVANLKKHLPADHFASLSLNLQTKMLPYFLSKCCSWNSLSKWT
jgi:hypothetical protein